MTEDNGRVVPIRTRSRARGTPLGDEPRRKFIEAIREGHTAEEAKDIAGMGKAAMNRAMEDPEFRVEYRNAREGLTAARTIKVEDTLYEMATSGEDTRATETWLRAHDPDRYQEKLKVEHSIAPSDEELERFREMGQDEGFREAALLMSRTVGRLDNPDIVDEA